MFIFKKFNVESSEEPAASSDHAGPIQCPNCSTIVLDLDSLTSHLKQCGTIASCHYKSFSQADSLSSSEREPQSNGSLIYEKTLSTASLHSARDPFQACGSATAEGPSCAKSTHRVIDMTQSERHTLDDECHWEGPMKYSTALLIHAIKAVTRDDENDSSQTFFESLKQDPSVFSSQNGDYNGSSYARAIELECEYDTDQARPGSHSYDASTVIAESDTRKDSSPPSLRSAVAIEGSTDMSIPRNIITPSGAIVNHTHSDLVSNSMGESQSSLLPVPTSAETRESSPAVLRCPRCSCQIISRSHFRIHVIQCLRGEVSYTSEIPRISIPSDSDLVTYHNELREALIGSLLSSSENQLKKCLHCYTPVRDSCDGYASHVSRCSEGVLSFACVNCWLSFSSWAHLKNHRLSRCAVIDSRRIHNDPASLPIDQACSSNGEQIIDKSDQSSFSGTSPQPDSSSRCGLSPKTTLSSFNHLSKSSVIASSSQLPRQTMASVTHREKRGDSSGIICNESAATRKLSSPTLPQRILRSKSSVISLSQSKACSDLVRKLPLHTQSTTCSDGFGNSSQAFKLNLPASGYTIKSPGFKKTAAALRLSQREPPKDAPNQSGRSLKRCPKCNVLLRDYQSNYERHVHRCTRGLESYACKFCWSSLSSPYGLSMHEKSNCSVIKLTRRTLDNPSVPCIPVLIAQATSQYMGERNVRSQVAAVSPDSSSVSKEDYTSQACTSSPIPLHDIISGLITQNEIEILSSKHKSKPASVSGNQNPDEAQGAPHDRRARPHLAQSVNAGDPHSVENPEPACRRLRSKVYLKQTIRDISRPDNTTTVIPPSALPDFSRSVCTQSNSAILSQLGGRKTTAAKDSGASLDRCAADDSETNTPSFTQQPLEKPSIEGDSNSGPPEATTLEVSPAPNDVVSEEENTRRHPGVTYSKKHKHKRRRHVKLHRTHDASHLRKRKRRTRPTECNPVNMFTGTDREDNSMSEPSTECVAEPNFNRGEVQSHHRSQVFRIRARRVYLSF